MPPAESWPPGLQERVRIYLAALVTAPPTTDELIAEVDARAGARPDESAVFAAAHDVVRDHARVAPDLEVFVLAEEAGVAPETVAAVLGWSQAEVEELLDDVRSTLGALDTDRPGSPPTGDDPPRARDAGGKGRRAAPERPRSRTHGTGAGAAAPSAPAPPSSPAARPRNRAIAAAIAVAAIVAVVAVVVALREGPGDRCAATSVTCVLELRITDEVGLDGVPGPDRERLATTDDVVAWFRVRPQPRGDEILSFTWFREGEELYESIFRLGEGDTVHVRLGERFSAVPGTYRIEIRSDGEVLATDEVELVAS